MTDIYTHVTNKQMKLKGILLGCVGLLALGACTSTQQVATSEYDDVYYTSEDYTERSSQVRQRSYSDRDDYGDSRYYEDGYRAYDEDDFYISRRIRRFNQPNNNAWRYYDPFFTNDLYYVMGTPTWNRWNSNGWYNWNRPRFGASVSLGFGSPLWASRSAFYDPFWGANSFNYYNPWVSSYYGFDPYFGYGFNRGFGSPFGFRNSFIGPSSYFYCPPSAYVSTAAFRNTNVSRRASLSSLRSQTGYRQNPVNNTRTSPTRRTSTSSTRRTPTTASSNSYLTPKTDLEKRATLSEADRRRNAVRRSNAAQTRELQRRSSTNSRSYPSRNTRVSPSNSRRTPSVNRRTPSTNRRSTVPNSARQRTTRPSYNRQSSPSRRSTPSYNRTSRPSSSRTPSMSRPSSSSRSSGSSSRSSSSSSRRRP